MLRELVEFLPGLRKRLNAVAEGMIDLMEPFRRRDIYHWRMNGSYSLKSVLPVLVPEMTYDGMEISDGAMDLWWASSGCWRRCGGSDRPIENQRRAMTLSLNSK